MGLQEGDKLPSHASLAKELNVSIPSLREGLQMLTTLGVLRINHGVGTTVAKPSVSDYFQILNSLLNSKPRAREECLEVRRQLEPWIAGKLAKKGGSYPHLQDSIKRLEEAAADHDIEAFINEYLTFHGRLCRLAGKSVIAEILNLVNRLLFSGKDLEVLVSEHTSDVIEHCRQLLKAIEKQDRNKAEEIMTAHVALLVQRPRMSIVYDTFSTGSIGGSFYSAGRELCRILNRYGGISIESEPSGGGIENVELTSEGKAILGLTQSDVAYHAFQGVAPFFKPHKQIRAVCGAHNLDLWIVARKNSGIVNIFDLQGKRIAMGATGGESVIIAKALLEAHGIHEGDYRPFYLSISNAVHSMRNSEIDLIFYLSNGPGSALAELFEEVEIRILGIDSRYLNSILKNHPYWKQSTIKQNIWSELDHDIHTLGTPTPLITHQDVPDKLIRKITAAIMEHAADADNLHVNHSRIDSILVEKMELASGRLIAWGNVVETAVIDRLIKLKVDTIGSDHALPQKASKTRSKLYAGKGAFLAMWTYRYPAMIQELRENFPEAELALVPPIKNPKGGVLGLSVVPGYRPFCISSMAADPQLVWDKFIETVILTTEGSMLLSRGIPGVSYKVVDNTFKDNFEESGTHMKTRPPLNPNIKFPYKLPLLMQRGAEMEAQFDEWFSENSAYAVAEEPSVSVPAFDMIHDDMKDKKNELFWKYVMGQHSFEEMMKQFDAYKKETDFDNILAEINGKL